MTQAPRLDTSAVLRAWLEAGSSPDIEARILAAPALVTSRLSLVESFRALLRLRTLGTVTELQLADAERGIDGVWARCEVWELSREIANSRGQSHPGDCCARWMRCTSRPS